MTTATIPNELDVATKALMEALRLAAKAIVEAIRRDEAEPNAISIEIRHRNADLVPVIEAGARAMLDDQLVQTRNGGFIIRRGVDLFGDGPRSRLYRRLRFEALKASGTCDEI